MNWRQTLALLFGAASPFAFGKAEAVPTQTDTAAQSRLPAVDRDAWVFTDPAQRQRYILLAGHSSHASHSSHSSHYSGSGGVGGDDDSSPVIGGASGGGGGGSGAGSFGEGSPGTLPGSPSYQLDFGGGGQAAPPTQRRLTDKEVSDMLTKVQLALATAGYDPGPINGQLSDKTKAALSKFQTDHKLDATGFVDVQTLRLLSVIK